MKFLQLSLFCIIFMFAGISGFVIYKMYTDQQDLRTMLAEKYEDQEKNIQKEIIVERIQGNSDDWSALQAKIKNNVVQIFAQVSVTDILQPYKTPNEGQVYGTGFFISKDGEIVTNAHVIDQAKTIRIQFPGGGKQQIDVDLVGASPDRDIALLKVKPEGLALIKQEIGEIQPLSLGNSDQIHRADEIMTLGYPLGQQGLKSTVGVVSGREAHLIQIDAAINPGNSGGPSLDRLGRVIGINTLYAPDAQNIGYIIPINEFKVVYNDLKKVKLLRKPFLGVLFNNASDSLTKYLGNPEPGGLYVVDVYKDSPLHKAGVQKGDMIYEINGHRLDYYGELAWTEDKISIIDYVSQLRLGQKIKLVVYRKGKRQDITLSFNQSELLPIRKIYPGYEKIDYEIVAGMVIQPLTINHLPLLINSSPSLAKYTEMKHQMESALIITHIFADSQAQRSRSLSLGAILKEVNGKPVKTLSDLREALYKGLQSENLTVETAEGVFVVCPFKKVLAEDFRLAKDYFIPLSQTMQTLIAKAGLDKEPLQPNMLIADNKTTLASREVATAV